MARSKKKKNRRLFTVAYPNRKSGILSRKQARALIGAAKKEGQTALDKIYALIETNASDKKSISLHTVHSIHRHNINCGKTSDYTMYQAIKRYNKYGNNELVRASYSKKNRQIQFIEKELVS